MAEFHLHGQIIKRSEGRSAVNAAAYRAGEALYDKRLDRTFDYTRKQEVEESIILGPAHAPRWLFDRELLWNTVEAAERHKAAQLSREFDIGLPIELVEKDPAAAKAVLKAWVDDRFVAEGLMVDINFHDMESHNPHAHIMTTMRRVDEQATEFEAGSPYAFESTKARDQNDWGYMDFWRETWADYANMAMEKHGIDARIDHRTLIEQGIDREPSIHIGPNVKAMDDRGIETDRATKNGIIWYVNSWVFFEEIDRYVAFLDAEAAEEAEAQRKEVEAAEAIVVRAGELRDLGFKLDAAVARQISRRTTRVAEAAALLHPGAQKAITNAQAALDDLIGALDQRSGKIDAGLSRRREEVARVEVDLDNAAWALTDALVSRLTRLGGRLANEIGVVLGDKAVRFYKVADLYDAKKRADFSARPVALHDSGIGTDHAVGRVSGNAAEPRSTAKEDPLLTQPSLRDDQRHFQQPSTRRSDPVQRPKVQLSRFESSAGRARTFAGKLTAAAGVAKAVGAAILADARMLAKSMATVLWRPVPGAAEGFLSTADRLGRTTMRKLVAIAKGAVGPAVTRAASVFTGRDRGEAEDSGKPGQELSAAKTAIDTMPPQERPAHSQDEGSRRALALSLIELARSLASRLQQVRTNRKARAEKRAAKAANAALDLNLRRAERAIRTRVEHSAPETERLFVADWIRTLKVTDGPMQIRYEEADLAALKGYVLRMERQPGYRELDQVLVRLSPSAGGVLDSAKMALDELPEGMRPDLGHGAIYSKHVQWVLQEVSTHRDVVNHLQRLLRASVWAEPKAEVNIDCTRGPFVRRYTGRSDRELED